ncbi:MAG: hypothetical protein AB8G16_12410 [Gammaproteobacteria bacterium]
MLRSIFGLKLTFVSGALCVALTLFACTPESAPREDVALQFLISPTATSSAQPHLAVSPGGQVVLSWLNPDHSGVTLYSSMLDHAQWGAPSRVASGDNWFVNWADFPSVVPLEDDLWAAHWLVKKDGGTYSYDISLALSQDAGASWSAAVIPHRDNTPTEHGFVSLFSHRGGAAAVWLDGRNAGGAGHDHGASTAQMTLRSAVLGRDLTLSNEALLDERVCDCCQTDAAQTPAGPLVVYRDRSADEVRDISIASATSAGWDAPRPLSEDGWEISGCPVNGPAIASFGSAVATAWYTGADDQARVRFARSDNGGVTFAPPVQVDGDQALGRVDVVVMPDGSAAVSWIRRDGPERGTLMVRRIDVDGVVGLAHRLIEISPSRASGFPQMVLRGADLVFAWTEVEASTTTVRTALLTDALSRL